MRTFHTLIDLDLTRRGSYKGHTQNTFQMSSKFVVNVVLYAEPDSMKSLTRKQYPNDVIGLCYPNAVI